MFAILVNKHTEAPNPKYEATLLGGESNLILSRRFLKRKVDRRGKTARKRFEQFSADYSHLNFHSLQSRKCRGPYNTKYPSPLCATRLHSLLTDELCLPIARHLRHHPHCYVPPGFILLP